MKESNITDGIMFPERDCPLFNSFMFVKEIDLKTETTLKEFWSCEFKEKKTSLKRRSNTIRVSKRIL